MVLVAQSEKEEDPMRKEVLTLQSQGPFTTAAEVYGSLAERFPTHKLADKTTAVADDNYLRESILNPRAQVVTGYNPIMPTYQGRVTEQELFELIAYIKALAPVGGGAP